jgi:hypothetical protein
LLVEALELMSSAVTELIEHHDGLHEDVLLLRGDRELRTAGKGGGQMAASPDRQYSSGRRIAVTERSASVITQSRSGGFP